MVSDRVRLLLAGLCCLAGGAIACLGSARALSGALLLVAGATAIAWPLGRPRPALPALEPVPPPPALEHAALQAQLDHLPVAAWLSSESMLLPLSSRAHRLAAPGGVRDATTLQRLLRNAPAGPVQLETERGIERWHLHRQALNWRGQALAVLTLTPLESQLEAESLQAWQQLVQVLTHEIMNSLTPVQSLSQNAIALLDEPDAQDDLRLALDTIGRRARSLQHFVEGYRRVSQWPAPVMAPVDLAALFARMERIVAPGWQARGGAARFELNASTLQLQADAGQLEQALLALVRNAEQATDEVAAPQLLVQARTGRGGRLHLGVRDNGPGVPLGLERQIFVPFFSAREGGQGIGLTVVRQLVQGMGGRVRHVRPLDGGAEFVLIF